MASGNNGRVFWTAAAGIITLDVITKALAVRYLMPQHIPHPIIGEFVRFTLAFNPGAAFSMSLGAYSRVVFGTFAFIALIILWRLYRASSAGETIRVLALGLAWGGAAGNLIDRVLFGSVVDFVDVYWQNHHFWAFNVADSAITVGVAIMILDMLGVRAHASKTV